MDLAIAIVFSGTCLYLLLRALRPRDAVDFQLGVIGLFAFGYYCIPVFFKDLSPLGDFSEKDIFTATAIHYLFLLSVVFGTYFGRRYVPQKIGLRFDNIDSLAERHRIFIAISAFACYLIYYLTQDITSYTATNHQAFFNDRGPLFAAIAAVASLCVAFIAVLVAYSWNRGASGELAFYGAMLSICVFLALFLGQRLAILTPIMMLLAGLCVTGQTRRAVGVLGVAVCVLLLVSPVAVFVRESLADRRVANAQMAVGSFSYGDDALRTIFQSIIDRGDALYVTVRMKPVIDQEPSPGFIYYQSVFAIPIPRAVYPTKPFVLSDNGSPSGELSIKAWNSLIGGTGSLTAFGGLVAYREGSWPGVFVNGLATGILFVIFARWLGGGGFVARVFYASLFVLITVKKVPPSFFEALSEFMGMVPFLSALAVVFLIIRWLSPRHRLNRPEGGTTRSDRLGPH